jgi:hypothetical protein
MSKRKAALLQLEYARDNTSIFRYDLSGNYGVYCHIRDEFVFVGSRKDCFSLLSMWGFTP